MSFSEERWGCEHPIAQYSIFCEMCFERVYCSERCREVDMLQGMHIFKCKGRKKNPRDSPDVPYDVPDEDNEDEPEQRSGIVAKTPNVLKKVKQTELEDAVHHFFFNLPGGDDDDGDGGSKSPYLTPTQRV
ncbi:MAG: hypothetical protein K2Q45_00345 [Nitrosomonas sp.]|nr:hypothetical protein [Nitrosomonas sp.]